MYKFRRTYLYNNKVYELKLENNCIKVFVNEKLTDAFGIELKGNEQETIKEFNYQTKKYMDKTMRKTDRLQGLI